MKWLRNWIRKREYKVLLKHYQMRVDSMDEEEMNKHVKKYLVKSVKKYKNAIKNRSK